MDSTEKRIEQEFNCIGYFGLGSGIHAYRTPPKLLPGRNEQIAMYCNGCAVAQECWDRHRDRVRDLYPEVTAELDRLYDKHNDTAKAIEEFQHLHGDVVEPYLSVMAGNVEDGSAIAAGQSPKDRGKATIIWPPKT